MIIWITGLSGCGKSTIGKLVYQRWKLLAPNTVIVDGDDVRRLFALETATNTYTETSRRKIAGRFVDLCAWLDNQGINVICCTISLFSEIHQRNRETFSQYFEVYIEVPMKVLYHREGTGLYKRALAGEVENVVGIDIPFSPPIAPNWVIYNSKDRESLQPLADALLEKALAY